MGLLPLWLSWSLLHCLQIITNLPDENMTIERTKSTLSKSMITLGDCLRLLIVWSGEQTSRSFNNGSPRSIRFWIVFPTTETIRPHKSRAENTIKPQSCVHRDDFSFCWTVWNRSLFLAHPTYWNKCMTSKNAQCSSRSGFWIFKISRKIRILK